MSTANAVKSIPWSSEFAVGHDDIDSQHQALFGLLVRAEQAVAGGGRGLAPLAKDISKGLKAHFDHEYRLMKDADYPELDGHHGEHEAMVASADALRNATGDAEQSAALQQLLTRFYYHHLKGDDLKLGRFLARRASA